MQLGSTEGDGILASEVPSLLNPLLMSRVEHKNYLLTVLLVILAFNYVDRLAMGLLMEDIKVDLNLTDTQLGLLTGIAFAFFYAVMGIPIARWADRGNRVTIIALTVGLWSAAVALCGAVTSFAQLLLIRIGVAVGEAGCQPPALSLIADHFARADRSRAVARYMLGWPIALVIGNFATGWLNELYGWRVTFFIIGAPGVALAILAAFTLIEPRRSPVVTGEDERARREPSEVSAQLALKDVFVALWANVAYRHLLLCFSIAGFFTYGILQWQPAFFLRSHGLETGELGTWLAVVNGLAGLLGTYIGGELASRYAASNERLQLKLVAILYVVFAVLKAAVYLSPNYHIAFGFLAFSILGVATTNGPMYAVTQTVVPPHMRAVSIALVLFFMNLIGMGLGPLAAGALSDAFRQVFGEESLRYALVALCPGYIWAACHAWRASRALASRSSQDRVVNGLAGTPVS